jgi:hypothetical protein
MESTNFSPEPQADSNKNRNLIIGIVVAIVLCCCCTATAIAGYYGYQAYVETQRAIQEFQNFEIPEIATVMPFDSSDPNSSDIPIPGFDMSGQVPEGGLADNDTRFTAWLSVQIIASVSGCANPTAQGTTISVTQQPDSNGVWVEEWNVNCGDGASKPYNVTFTPQSGFVDVEVEFPMP